MEDTGKIKIYVLEEEGDSYPEFFRSREQAEAWKDFYLWCDPDASFTIKEGILNDADRFPVDKAYNNERRELYLKLKKIFGDE